MAMCFCNDLLNRVYRTKNVRGIGDCHNPCPFSLFTERTRIVAITNASNVLGTVNPVKEIIAEAHRHEVPVLIDGAQIIQHGIVDVADVDCDFFVFSGHKIYGPNGIGVLYGKEKWLNEIPPYQGGGDMVASVTFEKTTYNELPFKFE